ncbi:MAG: pyridoxamine 5'-phosphate oxidase family protein [Acidimicrobiia bacterium]|nr:pyridoxamine 5'-phosphate oxidase family protein [Acidimicrobiia bacterium]
MGRSYEEITDGVAGWIGKQQMFFVATAPADGGHINVSPKGLDTLRIVGSNTVEYLDLTGSGAETIAHLRDNGRVTMMFCAFDGPPRIVRLYGKGSYIAATDMEFAEAAAPFGEQHGARSVIRIDVDRVADSCGYAVPRYEYVEQRTKLRAWADNRDDEELKDYWAEKNAKSIDGLPALEPS